MNVAKIFFITFSVLLLIYLILPGPKSVFDFPQLENSQKSIEPGDTIQIPNVVAYFSYSFRNYIISFYRSNYKSQTRFFFPPLRLNHPPEYSWEVVRDQIKSTYLEEMVYPMRDSLFINGLEPFLEDGTPRYQGAVPIEIGGTAFDTKTTLRYYPSSVKARLIVWIGVMASIYFLWKVGKKVVLNA